MNIELDLKKKIIIVVIAILIITTIIVSVYNYGTSQITYGPDCGDGFCNGNETLESCPNDCSVNEEIPMPGLNENLDDEDIPDLPF